MNRLLEKLRSFLLGRYGTDGLSWFIFGLAVAVTFVNNFTRGYTLRLVLWLLSMALMLIWILRYFSRDFEARRRENAVFMRLWKPVGGFFKLQINRFRDRKTHVYFRCRSCGKVLRVPKGRGNITVTCPVCGTKTDKKT